MKIEATLEPLIVPIDSIRPWPENPRRGDIDAVARSLSKFGQQKPIVVHARPPDIPVVIAGNHTWHAAKKLEAEGIAATAFTGTVEEANAYALADNRTSEMGTIDPELLLAITDQLPDDLLRAASYEESDLDLMRQLAAGDAVDGSTPSDGSLLSLADVAVGPPAHVVKPGDIYRIGGHVLIVADIMTEWPLWSKWLTEGALFVPYPGPYAALSVKAENIPLLMVQPDLFLAGHLLDKYAAMKGEDSIEKVPAPE